jgi:hypothetical protein
MHARVLGLALSVLAGALAAVLVLSGAAAAPPPPAPGGEVIYSNMPAHPQGLPVLLFESWSASEFGGEVSFAGSARKDPTVSFLLASYACQSGKGASCRTSPGASFSWPLTLEIYQAGAGASMAGRVARVTHTFTIPYRPSATHGCHDEGWTQGYGPECSFALMHKVSFSLPGTTLPKSAVIALQFNTENYGPSPAKKRGPYNGLGMAVDADYTCVEPSRSRLKCLPGGYRNLGNGTPRVGSNPVPQQVFIETTYEPLVCGGPAGSFGATGECWIHEQPAIEVRANA